MFVELLPDSGDFWADCRPISAELGRNRRISFHTSLHKHLHADTQRQTNAHIHVDGEISRRYYVQLQPDWQYLPIRITVQQRQFFDIFVTRFMLDLEFSLCVRSIFHEGRSGI